MATEQQNLKQPTEAGAGADPVAEEQSGALFRRTDWLAFLTTFLITVAVYTYTLAPTVTLEDSGELAVASDYLGVPHPPGYPIWTLLTWFSQWVFHWVTFRGHPNPGWSVGLASAVFGALACGFLAMLVSRSGKAMLSKMQRATEVLGYRTEELFSFTVGTCAGLLLAFSPGIWSQSVIVEVYSLNSLFLSIILLLLYRWMVRPQEPASLYVMAFLFGLGLTNHQTLLFVGLALAVGIMVRDFALFRDFLIAGLVLFLLVLLPNYLAKQNGTTAWLWISGPDHPGFWFYSISALVVPMVAYFALPRGKEVCYTILLVELGISFYVYLPLASDQNPPINWGYPRTWQGFIHAITRGQYERISTADVFTAQFVTQIGTYLTDLRRQFTLPVALLGFLPFAAWRLTLGHRKVNAFLVSLTLWAAAFAFIVLENALLASGATAGTGAIVTVYKVLASGMVLLAGVGIVLMVYSLLKDILLRARGIRETPFSERALSFLVLAGIAVLYLAYAFMLLKTLRPAEAGAPSPGGLHVMVVLAFVFGPPVAFALVHLLVTMKSGLAMEIDEVSQRWNIATLMAFALVSVILMIFLNPKLDIQTLFIQRVQLIQSHAVFALWLGYGLLFALAWLETLLVGRAEAGRRPYQRDSRAERVDAPDPERGRQFLKIAGITFVALLPLLPILRNAYDTDLLRVVGGAEQNGHDFGWQFGHYQLQGSEAINAELDPDQTPLPNPAYPPPMDPDAVFFGGTDPGRFVPTYMIYSAHVREDVFLITQNALADNTYLAVMRDLYGSQIWLPSLQDSTAAFQQYVSDVKSGRIPPGAQVTMKDGRVSVQGVQGVMMINGILTQQIFDHNKHKNTFYVEESYVIPWMYPYMEPHGLILKVNKNPLRALTPEMVKNDHDFWAWYTERLLSNPKFMRDVVARKTFSKLRGAIGGLYAYRRMFGEAAYAFGQARDLYDLSPEANFRLAEIHVRQGKYEEAIALTEDFLLKDPGNAQVRGYLARIVLNKAKEERRRELEPLLSKGGTVPQAFELLGIYRDLQLAGPFDSLSKQLIGNPGMTADGFRQGTRMAAGLRRFGIALQFARRHTERFPKDPNGWIDLAAVQVAVGQPADVRASLEKALEVGGEPVRPLLARDERFKNVRDNPVLREFFTAPSTPTQPLKLPF